MRIFHQVNSLVYYVTNFVGMLSDGAQQNKRNGHSNWRGTN